MAYNRQGEALHIGRTGRENRSRERGASRAEDRIPAPIDAGSVNSPTPPRGEAPVRRSTSTRGEVTSRTPPTGGARTGRGRSAAHVLDQFLVDRLVGDARALLGVLEQFIGQQRSEERRVGERRACRWHS